MRDKCIRMQQRLITKERHAPKVLSTLQIIMSLARTQSRTKVLLSNNPLDYRKSVYKKKKIALNQSLNFLHTSLNRLNHFRIRPA